MKNKSLTRKPENCTDEEFYVKLQPPCISVNIFFRVGVILATWFLHPNSSFFVVEIIIENLTNITVKQEENAFKGSMMALTGMLHFHELVSIRITWKKFYLKFRFLLRT